MTVPVTSDTKWLSGRQARLRAGGLTATALLKLAALGRVRTQAKLGEPIRYSASDIDLLAGSGPQETVD